MKRRNVVIVKMMKKDNDKCCNTKNDEKANDKCCNTKNDVKAKDKRCNTKNYEKACCCQLQLTTG